MQAAGQFGDVPQYVGSRVGASNGHMFNISHEMSLSSSSSTPGQPHAHGHSLPPPHPSPQSQASQSHIQVQIAPAATQPPFLQQQQQQQQQQQHGFIVSMGGAPPKASSIPSPTSHQPVHAPQPTKALQSASQQLQADIKQHQLQQIQQTAAHDHGPHQQATSGDPIQLIKPKEQAVEVRGSIAGTEIAPSVQGAMVPKGGVPVREETSGDGEEVDEELERGSGGNRWPRQEALALLKIRSEMDAAFRDSSLKGPLWEEISRKLAEMGYHRSAKKCKEKFENVHKYYKRTKEGKTGRQDGKSYRFFTQLEALYGKAGDSSTTLINLNNSKSPLPHASSPVSNNHVTPPHGGLLICLNGDHPSPAAGLVTAANHHNLNHSTGNFSGPAPLASFPPFKPTSAAAASASAAAAAATNAHIARTLERVESMKRESENNTPLQYFLDSSDESDDDDDDDDGDDDDDDFDEPAARESTMHATQNPPTRGKKRKRTSLKKYLVFFEKVMKKVLDKQEHMQQKFLEALERRDQDRMIREEAWKRQEMARLNREHDVRAAERALSASRDASLVAFLQKMTGQSITVPHQSSTVPFQTTNQQYSTAIVPADYMQNESNADRDRDAYDPCSKRWPKPEVLALIKLRTCLDQRFHEPGSKAVLWEEISAGMTSQGFARTAKRCKEKWENINKYFKKAKESNKKRPENAKTCPYFHHLNALYKEGLLGGGGGGGGGGGAGGSSISSKHLMVTEKGEEQSDDVMDDQGGNTSKYSGEESGQAQEGNSAPTLRAGKEMEGSGLANLVQPANASAIISTSVGIITPPASITLQTSSTSSETKMHMFMGSERGDVKDHAGVMKHGVTSSDIVQQLQPSIGLSSATAPNVNHEPAQGLAANALPFNLVKQ